MKCFVKDLMEKTWYLIEKLIPSPIFLFSCYMKHKIKEILGFYEHFSVSFFTDDIRAHWKDPVKPGAAPVLPLYLQVGMWPGSAGCIASAHWPILVQPDHCCSKGEKTWSAVILNSLLLVKEHPLKKPYKKLDPVIIQEGSVHSKQSYPLLVIFPKHFPLLSWHLLWFAYWLWLTDFAACPAEQWNFGDSA